MPRELPDPISDDGDPLAEQIRLKRGRAKHSAGRRVQLTQLRLAQLAGALIQGRTVEYQPLGERCRVVWSFGDDRGRPDRHIGALLLLLPGRCAPTAGGRHQHDGGADGPQ